MSGRAQRRAGGAVTGVARWRAEVAAPQVYELAEGPRWDAPRERLLWVDIPAGAVHEGRLAGDRVALTGSRTVDRYVGAVACSAAGDLLVAGMHGLFVVTADGQVRPGPTILPAGSARRLNDGACDPAGAFLVGSLSLTGQAGGEVLVRVAADGAVAVLDADLTLSNGLAWSPDGRLLYSIDTEPGVVWVRPYDPATGAAGERRELLRPTGGLPDGMCVDDDGCLWIAFWGGGEVRRYSPDGRLTGVVEVPAPQVTSAAFVGPGRDRLLITTAAEGLTGEQRARFPDSGRLFLADVGATGPAATPWAGWTDRAATGL